MGYSNWSNDSYADYARTTNLHSASRTEVFTSRHLPEKLDPKKITLRESRDSDFNPKSTPVIFSLDITGSMGYIAEAIAKDGLPSLMGKIYEDKPISDPHVMFMGFGDTRASDRAPFQMSQFEADIRIVEQLRELYLEGGGGGNDSESVIMSWYAADTLTDTDASKRGDKGFLFTISDECVPPDITARDLTRVFGDRANDMKAPASNQALLKSVCERYNTFHIIAEDGSYARTSYAGRSGQLHEGWQKLMGTNLICMADHKDLTDIVLAIFEVEGGKDIHQVIKDSDKPGALIHAFKYALATTED